MGNCTPVEDDDDGDTTEEDVTVDWESSCEGINITVREGTDPLGGASVEMRDYATLFSLDSGTTNGDGQVMLNYECDKEVQIRVNGDVIDLINLPACDPVCEGLCVPECPEDTICIASVCVPAGCTPACEIDEVCDAGTCVCPYACCADDDCPEGLTCEDHTCKQHFECTIDAECAPTYYCNIVEDQTGGNCKEVTGQCGYASNHAWVPYECGDELGCPGCPSGLVCTNHECVGNDLTCPSSGVVGDQQACAATQDGKPCIGCDYRITDPTGKTYTGKTDENGNLKLPLQMEGTYKVALFKEGLMLKQLSVQAFPKSAPEEPGGKPLTGGIETYFLWLLLLLLLVIAIVIYWRSRGGKKAAPPQPAQPAA
jgi:hypothetical protein